MAYSNVTRVTGLSGMDTEAYVTSLMKAESQKLVKTQKQAMLISLRQDLYRSVYSDLLSFQKSFLSMTAAGSIRAGSTFSGKITTVKTAAGQDSGAVTVGSGSKEGKYSVKVHKLAVADLYESASRVGGEITSAKDFVFDAASIREGATYELSLDGYGKKVSFKEGDAVEGGTLTFTDGKIGIKAANGTVTQLTEAQFIEVFNQKLKAAFGMEGTGAGAKQKIEAKLTDSGGISIFTNGYHTGFSIADGTYNFSSAVGENKSALANGAATSAKSLGFVVGIGSSSTNINVNVTEGMTQQQMLDAINEQLESKGLGNKVFAHIDANTGKVKIVNFSSSETATISDQTGAAGSMEYLGFDNTMIALAPSGSLTDLGITSGSAPKFNANRTLSEIFGDNLTSEASFTINGKSFSFSGSTKLGDLMKQVNNAGLGVTMRYDEYNETFQLESNNTGYVNKISFSGALLTDNLGFGTIAKREAADSVATVNGITVTRSSNEFEFLGVEWKLNNETDGELTVNISKNTDKVVDQIKGFVEGYNAMIEKLSKYTSTSRPKYNGAFYDPLTSDEKSEMKEKDIELWEEKSKEGLLYNDSILTKITRDLRTALNQSVTLADGSKISLSSLGITTSNDWTKGGQLMIDEDQLRKAVEAYGDDVTTLFTKTSEEGGKGLAERVNDIFNSAVSTKGSIASRAGIVGTYTESNNELYRQLKAKNDKIDQMLKQLAVKETNYYNMFSRMESAMSKANSQMQYVQSMLGS